MNNYIALPAPNPLGWSDSTYLQVTRGALTRLEAEQVTRDEHDAATSNRAREDRARGRHWLDQLGANGFGL